jgi:hypothetical protein
LGSISRLADHVWSPDQKELVRRLRGLIARFEDTVTTLATTRSSIKRLFSSRGSTKRSGRIRPCLPVATPSWIWRRPSSNRVVHVSHHYPWTKIQPRTSVMVLGPV